VIEAVGTKGHSANFQSVLDARRLLMFLCYLPLVALRVWLICTPKALTDFWVYWTSGHLFLTGENPYSAAQTYATLQMQGWTSEKHLVMICPPWTLPVTGLMALVPLPTSKILWYAICLVLDCFSALALWNYFGGEKRKSWIAIAFCLTFVPMGFAEWMGQITPLILACLTAFLLLERSKQYFLAGFFLFGFGLKPQLLYLVSLTILLWIVKKRLWTMLAGAALSYTGSTIFAYTWNHNSFDYFRNAYGPVVDTYCGLGGALRFMFGIQHIWLQFLPCVIGLAWFLRYWIKNHRQWDWRRNLPLLLTVSICSSPYFWFHDFILLLPVVIALAVRGSFRSPYTVVAYSVAQLAVFATALPPVWMCAASILWIPFYWVATMPTKRVGLA